MKNLYKLLIGVLALSTVTSCDDYGLSGFRLGCGMAASCLETR